MFDCHYDLLTFVLLYNNNGKLDELKKYCRKVFVPQNITGGIFNLYYMSPQEMQDELRMTESNVIEDLKKAKQIILQNDILPKNFTYIVGIEGLDYLQNINDIDVLYDLGLRSTNIVWNNKNKFGVGVGVLRRP